ncbi:hypothetical protein [Rhabdochromatium marinum]|uniref:hypothetical protein n=1 Tax=Rhabdochromatium marinum TaxID=48729 RepID=UPI0019081A45|nr:hypothetical protein [Rhabdochromatium marinum]MBK1647982.1 hypothetical protein [Rhabdochromatium marinum]
MQANLVNAGLMGIQRGYQGLAAAASDIARQTTAHGTANSNADLATPLVGMKVSEQTTEASVRVLGAADGMIGTLLDVMA